jgi:hypothetical protein
MGGDSKEFKDDPTFVPWGPFVSTHFVNEPISRTDIITASVVWCLTLVAACSAIFLGYGQTRSSRSPLRSAYVWMIWIELAVCFAMGLECYLHMLKTIRPSKPARYHRAQDLADSAQALHYTSLSVMLDLPLRTLQPIADSIKVSLWCIQTQLVLQIVINRIRVIVANRALSRKIMICTVAFVTAINISAVVLWVQARLQTSHAYVPMASRDPCSLRLYDLS